MPPLPQEIIDTILSSLADDHTTLQTCTLVSRNHFLPAARRYLFQGIKLSTPGPAQRFLNILASTPSIAYHIRTLILSNLRLLIQTDPHTVTALLTCLTRLRSLSLSYIFWDTLSPPLAAALESLVQAPTLRELAFIGVHDFPLELLAGLPQLERLSLAAMDRIPSPSPHTNTGKGPELELELARKGQLRILDIGVGSIRVAQALLSVLGNPTSRLGFAQLESLTIEVVNPETLGVFQALIAGAGPSLRSFSSKLDFSRWPGAFLFLTPAPSPRQLTPPTAPVELNSMPHLESFHLQVGCFCKSAEDPLSWLIQALSAYTGAPSLRALSVQLNRCWGWGSIQLCVRERQLQGKLTSPVWPTLDALLAGERFGSLEKVTMVISASVNPRLRPLNWDAPGAEGAPETDYCREVPRRMPLLRERGMLEVKRIKEPEDPTLDFYL
jgi:hypothetical protein